MTKMVEEQMQRWRRRKGKEGGGTKAKIDRNKCKDGRVKMAKMVEEQRQRWMRNKDKDGGRKRQRWWKKRTKAKMVEE